MLLTAAKNRSGLRQIKTMGIAKKKLRVLLKHPDREKGEIKVEIEKIITDATWNENQRNHYG